MGGKIALLGIPPGQSPVDWSRIVFKAITIKGVYGRELTSGAARALKLAIRRLRLVAETRKLSLILYNIPVLCCPKWPGAGQIVHK